MHQRVAENEHRAGRPLGRDQAALRHQLGHGLAIDDPERVAGRLGVQGRGHGTTPVRAANEHEGSVELGYLVEKDMEIERQRLRHAILLVVGGEVVVPLPDVAGEGLLGVHLDLLDVEVIAEDLFRGLYEARVAHEARVDVAALVQGHRRAHGVVLLLPEVFRPAFGEQSRQVRFQRVDLVKREHGRQDEEPVVLEPFDLRVRQLHLRFRTAPGTLTQNPFTCHHSEACAGSRH